MANWNTSNYHQRKAQRLAKAPAQWVQNPDTQEWFYLRPVGAMASLIAGMLPAALTGYAAGQWKESGMDVDSNSATEPDTIKVIEEGQRDLKMMANVISRACVIPLLVPSGGHEANYDPEFLNLVKTALAEKYDDFDPKEFTPESIMIEAELLDDSDVLFIFRWASGQIGKVNLNGGGAMNVADLKSVRKKLNRGSRTRAHKQELRTGT